MRFSHLELRGFDVIFSLFGANDITREEWDEYLALLHALKKRRGGDGTFRNVIVTDGAAPSAAQRKRLTFEVHEGRGSKVSVLTNSLTNPLKRGAATAISWLNPAFLAVGPERWPEALTHIDLDGQAEEILAEFERMQKTNPPVRTLTQLAVEIARKRSTV